MQAEKSWYFLSGCLDCRYKQEMRKTRYQCFCWTVLVYDPALGSFDPTCLVFISHHCEHLLDKKLVILSISSPAVHRQALGKQRPWGDTRPLQPYLHLGSHYCYQKWHWTSSSNKTRTGDKSSVQTPIKWRSLTLAWFWDAWETLTPLSSPILLLTWNSSPHTSEV